MSCASAEQCKSVVRMAEESMLGLAWAAPAIERARVWRTTGNNNIDKDE
jgi:hypothetical protein